MLTMYCLLKSVQNIYSQASRGFVSLQQILHLHNLILIVPSLQINDNLKFSIHFIYFPNSVNSL
jgi:hypothetical protein